MSAIAGLYAIADTAVLAPARLSEAVALAIAGGARAVQYRDKSGDDAVRIAQARALVGVCAAHRLPLIINDDLALAVKVGAQGVHVGRDDPALAEARRVLGERAIIGVSCYNQLALALAAQAAGADYVAFGSFFRSATKPAAVHATSELLRTAKRELRISMVAIGGITPENGGELVAAGADALAVINGLFGQADIRATARRYAALYAPPT